LTEPFNHKEEMDLKTAQNTTTAKLPILKQSEYDMWRLRIEQYFQVQDYALWDVIENGNSFIPTAQTITNADGTSTTLIPSLVTTKEKVQKKNDVKARSMLLMALPNEHLMTFNQYKDAKTLFGAIQTRFGGNKAIKKTQKNLLKQMYEKFSAQSTKSLDSIFNRLQKIVSQMAILGENISQEDLNLKFLRSLPSEWNTHVVVWRNKLDLDTLSFDNLYNNFKIVKQEETGRKVTINGSDTARYDKSKLECFNCHKLGHFVRECRQPKNEDSRNRNQDNSRRTVNVEETASKAMVAIDGAGLFSPPKLDLSNYGLEEFQQPEFKGYGPKTSNSVSEDICDEVKESPDAPFVKELVLDDKLEKKTVFPTKGIKREFSVARTPQQNRVAERKNRTLIEAARTMLADSKLATTFWAEAVNTTCYVQNKPVVAENQSNGSACKAKVETIPEKDYIVLPLWTQDPLFLSSSKDSPGDGFKPSREEEKKDTEALGNKDNEDIVYRCTDDPNMPNLEEIVYSDEDEECNKESTTKIYKNTTPRKRAYFDAEAKVIHMILSGIGDGIYFTVDACTTAKDM
nr:hypothetical protein [Tanacetum cinerariifolium]